MKKAFLICILSLAAKCGWSQQRQDYVPPNYEMIEKSTKDKSSATYYPKLLSRYKKNDTTLTLREMHLLYYGKFFQPSGENTFAKNTVRDSVQALTRKDNLNIENNKKLLGYYLKLHDSNPLDLENIYMLWNLYSKLKDGCEIYYDYKLNKLIEAIDATGNGLTQQSGYHIGSIPDEYAFLSLMGYKYGGSQSLRGHCDYLTIKDNKREGIFFDVEQILAEESRALGLDTKTK